MTSETQNYPHWALITGVSEGGIGDALVNELMRNNVNVIATGLSLPDLDYLQSIAPARLERLRLDVTDTASITTAVDATDYITGGKLKYLFNNAGYGYMMPLLDAPIKAVKENFDVNVFGLLAMTQAFFPLLREARGTVINQGSITGLPGVYQPFIGSYEASKSAVTKLSDVLRVELEPFGVEVVLLVTGDVRTQFWDVAASNHLPSSSLYIPIRKRVEGMMNGSANPTLDRQHSRERYARGVVRDVLTAAAPSAHIRRGFLGKTMWIVSWLMPYWILDWMYSRTAGLDKLKVLLERQEDRKAQQLRKKMGNMDLYSRLNNSLNNQAKGPSRHHPTIEETLPSPTVLLISIPRAIVYGTLYRSSTTLTFIYQAYHGFPASNLNPPSIAKRRR